MAYIANTALEIKVSNHEFDSIANITGKYQASNADAEVCPGFLATRASLVVNEGYDQVGPAGSTVTLTNTNTWIMNDAVDSDTAQKGIYACNPFDVNMASYGQGNFWKVGANTLSIKVPAGYLTTWTKIEFNNNNVYRHRQPVHHSGQQHLFHHRRRSAGPRCFRSCFRRCALF